MSLKERVRSCERCPLFNETPCGPVTGVGSGNFVVQEKLSYSQAAVGIPFSDDDGEWIRYLFSEAGLNYKKFYYTSLVKCYGDASKKEVKICKDWVSEEIKLKEPEYVLCLGKEVFYYLYEDCKRSWKMSDIIGNVYEQGGVKYIPIYGLEYIKNYGRKKEGEFVEVIEKLFKRPVERV